MAAPTTALVAIDQVPVNICATMVEAASQSCQRVVTSAPVTDAASANMDAISVSLSALSTAFTFGSILFAIITLIAGFTWGRIIAASAKDEAQKAAKECADEWMAKNGPRIIQAHVELLNDATVGEGDDAKAADDIGEGA